MNKYFATIRRFRLQSVFFRFYFYILLLVTFFTLLFALYMHQVFFSQYERSQNDAVNAFLSQCTEPLNTSVRLVSETLADLTRSEDVLRSVVTPEHNDVNTNFQTASVLRKTTASSADIDNLFLYESTGGTMFSSHGNAEALENAPYLPLIMHALQPDTGYIINLEENRYETTLFSFENELYLSRKFHYGSGRYLGTLVAKLNREHLFADLSLSLSESPYYLQITTQDGSRILSSGIWIYPYVEIRDRGRIRQYLHRDGVTGLRRTVFSRLTGDGKAAGTRRHGKSCYGSKNCAGWPCTCI